MGKAGRWRNKEIEKELERWALWWPALMQVVGDGGGGGSVVTGMGRRWWGSRRLGRERWMREMRDEMGKWRKEGRWRCSAVVMAAACLESGEAAWRVMRGSGEREI